MVESFFGIKNFKTVMVPFFRIKNFKSRKAVIGYFKWSCFIKLSYETQISWNNNNILISMKKDAEHISVNAVRATFLLHK